MSEDIEIWNKLDHIVLFIILFLFLSYLFNHLWICLATPEGADLTFENHCFSKFLWLYRLKRKC